jgi:hypothetical protein
MTTATLTTRTLTAADLTAHRGAFTQFLGDVWVLTRRSIARIRREPETLSDVTIQPVMFVLMFAYVFGGAIGVPASYSATPTRRTRCTPGRNSIPSSRWSAGPRRCW